MRVLCIHNRYQQEGGEDVALELEVNLLRQNGHETEVLLFENRQISTVADKLKTGLQSLYSFSSARSLLQAIDRFRPDIIHVHNLFFVASPAILVAANKRRVPVVMTLHNYRLVCSNALLMRDGQVCELCVRKKFPLAGIKYKCYRGSAIESALVTGITGMHKLAGTWKHYVDQYIVLTRFAKAKFLASSLDVQEHQLSVVPNFVPDTINSQVVRENFFLYVGRLSVEKGLPVLIKAFSNVSAGSLVIIGDGPERQALEQQAALYPNIRMVGKKNKAEVLDLMRRCKALVFPSVCYEGMPYTILEAFSLGTPVLASNLGAMAEMIKNEYNGLHFKPNDADDLKHCLTKFAALGEAQRILGSNARLTYEELYHPQIHYKTLMTVYQKAIERNRNK